MEKVIEKKTVVYIGYYLLPDGDAASQRVLSNAKLFKQIGYNVVLVGKKNIKSKVEFYEKGFSCYYIPEGKISKYYSIKNIKKILREYLPDLIVVYNFPAIASINLISYAHKYGAKVVIDNTEWYQPNDSNVILRYLKNFEVWARMYWAYKKMDGIISISSYLDNYWKNCGKLSVVIPPLVDKEQDKWKNTLEKDESNDVLSKIQILFAGTIAYGNKDDLVRMINILSWVDKKLPNHIELNIIGVSVNDYLKIFKVDKKETIPTFVKFLGRLSHEDTIMHLNSADIQFFLRGRSLANQAGFPTKFVESISSSTIVLTNPTSDLRDFLIEGVNGFFIDDSNEEKLKESVFRVLKNERSYFINIKKEINSFFFDYRNYTQRMNRFLKSLNVN